MARRDYVAARKTTQQVQKLPTQGQAFIHLQIQYRELNSAGKPKASRSDTILIRFDGVHV